MSTLGPASRSLSPSAPPTANIVPRAACPWAKTWKLPKAALVGCEGSSARAGRAPTEISNVVVRVVRMIRRMCMSPPQRRSLPALGASPEVGAPEDIDLLQERLGVAFVDDLTLLNQIGTVRDLEGRRGCLFDQEERD